MTTKTRRPKPPADFDDNPPLTKARLRKMRPASEVLPRIVEAARKAGRPPLEQPKVPVSIRLDANVLEAFKATGPGWQSRINATLAKAAPKLRAKA